MIDMKGIINTEAGSVTENDDIQQSAVIRENAATPQGVAAQQAAARLAEAVRFKTISYPEYEKIDFSVFGNFLLFLEKSYPNVHRTCKPDLINGYSPVYHWTGKDKQKKPILLIAHYDVVPVEEAAADQWEVDPFGGVIKDGYIWGRGTLDNKNQVIAIMEALEYLINTGYVPGRDIYLAFGFDEETGGNKGACRVSEHFEQKGISFDCVLDEGGAIIKGIMDGLEIPTALVGVAEKGSTNIRISVTGEGGHSSMPPKRTAIETLARVIDNINKNPMPLRLIRPVKEMFVAMAPHMKGMTFLLKNIKPLFPIIKYVLAKNPVTNALIRTTITFTMTGGGDAPNVLPQKAWAVANLRILQGDSVTSVIEHIKSINEEYQLEIEEVLRDEPSVISDTSSPFYKTLTDTINSIFPGVLIVPYLMAGGTDSKNYSRLSGNIFRFMAANITREDFNTIHASNERISFENLLNMINFYIKFIQAQ